MLRALIAALGLSAGAASAQDITSAEYDGPTTRYAHGVLGDDVEYGELVLQLATGKARRLILPDSRVFEDVAPRLFDVDGDGDREAIVVESDATRGARLAIYDGDGLVAATPFIGQKNRWLAPVGVGAADLDGDGAVELAYVDRPHLAKTLRVWRFTGGKLVPLDTYPGVTNHRIGERDIAGGIRDCGQGPEMIVADADWKSVVSIRYDSEGFLARFLSGHQGRDSFARAMACK